MAAPPALEEYNRKRDFKRTPEPKGAPVRSSRKKLTFLVQKHAATRLHYDLRLEWEGVLLSWAVTRGPSLDPGEKRLAVRTEDHPKTYGSFEGIIPKGEYGGGTVMLWDRGTWEPLHDPAEGLREGKLHFRIHGERMTGGWALVRMRGRTNGKRENWLLIKERDEIAADAGDTLVEDHQTSVKTGRSMEEIATDRAAEVWTSNRKSDDPSPARTCAAATKRKSGGTPPPFRKPQLATLVDAVPEGDGWLHEVKFDGYRCLAAVGGGKVRCYSRSGLDWTDKFASVAEALAGLNCDSALIDGEVVARSDATGSQFSALQKALGAGGALTYYAFDLLSLDGADLTGKPLSERKDRLDSLLAQLRSDDRIQYSEHVQGNGPKVLAAICNGGQEGIVAKRADAPYRGVRTHAWLKVKCSKRQEFVIGGWSPTDKKSRPFSSLLLGTFEDGRLRYRGRVGAGLTANMLETLAARLQTDAQKKNPFADVPRPVARTAHWVAPKHVAEVRFTEFTADGHVRHGVFLGLREDKEAREVTLEQPSSAPDAGAAIVHGVRLTHPDRVVFPNQGLTKRDLVAYYEAVAGRMMPLIENRPLSLVRCPQGRGAKCFFQKHASEGFPKALSEVGIEESSGERKPYLYVRDLASVVAAVQMGTLEFHIWGCRTDAVEKPDRLVFDLDPDDGLSFAVVKSAASDVRDRLADIGLKTSLMVTGGKGLHVIALLRRSANWDQVKDFAKGFAQAMTSSEPDRFVATMSKAKRKGKIFIDWLRNDRGSTAIAPYSTRARAGAPVAMPVAWSELAELRAANGFTSADAIARMAEPDPWASRPVQQSITRRMLEAVTKP